MALKQLNAKKVLEQLDLMTYGRWRNAEFFRALCKASTPRGRFESQQGFERRQLAVIDAGR
jgi:hypothetical protein